MFFKTFKNVRRITRSFNDYIHYIESVFLHVPTVIPPPLAVVSSSKDALYEMQIKNVKRKLKKLSLKPYEIPQNSILKIFEEEIKTIKKLQLRNVVFYQMLFTLSFLRLSTQSNNCTRKGLSPGMLSHQTLL